MESSLKFGSEKTEKEIEPSHQLAWCSMYSNIISVIDLETKEVYTSFDGAQLTTKDEFNNSWPQVKGIPKTNLLVSLNHCWSTSAKMEIFDISQEEQAKKVYSFEEVIGETGYGVVAYNPRRGILGALCVSGKIVYHLFKVELTPSKVDGDVVKLCRKSRWPSFYAPFENYTAALDFDPTGAAAATVECYGVCSISKINTGISNLDDFQVLKMNRERDNNICRWSTNAGDPFLFLKYDWNKLNILDVEKKTLTLERPIKLELGIGGSTPSIDVCESDGNLMASGGSDADVKIYDRRESKVVRVFGKVHTEWISCVKWSPNGDMLATTSADKTAKLLDFKTGKVVHSRLTAYDGIQEYEFDKIV